MSRDALIRLGSAIVVVASLLACAPANAAYPGANGKLAFVRDSQVWTMNADGTGQTQLTTTAPSYRPQWSPDGTRIAYTRGYGSSARVRVMDANGGGDFQVGPSTWAYSPTWTPDGKRLAYVAPYFDPIDAVDIYELVETDLDGSQRRLIHSSVDNGNGAGRIDLLEYSPRGEVIAFAQGSGPGDRDLWKVSVVGGVSAIAATPTPDEFGAGWSPSAGRVAYIEGLSDVEVYTVNPNGTGRTQITSNFLGEYGVEWAPDASKLVFSGGDLSCAGCLEIQTMNPDGTGRATITHTVAEETDPDWQPVPAPPPAGYPRPKGATPMSVSLVPAYDACSTPNRTHGPPLAFGSCNPPGESAAYRTTGTPDANGAAAGMVASLRLGTIVGNPATSADEADVTLTFSAIDVRCRATTTDWPCPSANISGGSDYDGRLRGRITARLTDRYNLPADAGIAPGTMTDRLLTFEPSCSPTADASVGSTCSLATTLDALIPGMVAEGKRAVIALGQVEIMDGDSSGAPTYGPVLLRQGVYVP